MKVKNIEVKKKVLYDKIHKCWSIEVMNSKITGFETPEEASRAGDTLVDIIVLLIGKDGLRY